MQNNPQELIEENSLLSKANARLHRLVQGLFEISRCKDHFSILLNAAKILLAEIQVAPKANLELYFFERTFRGKQGFSCFSMAIDSGLNSVPMIRLEGTSDMEHSFHEHLPYDVSNFKDAYFFQGDDLFIPIAYQQKLVGLILIREALPWKEDLDYFLQTFVNFVAVSLEEITFVMILEYTNHERTKELKTALENIEAKHIELLQSHQKLVQSEKMSSLGTLIAGVAHEINNPTNFTSAGAINIKNEIADFAQFAQKLFGSDEELWQEFNGRFLKIQPYIDSILDGTQRIKQIVNDLRVFSRVEQEELKMLPLCEGLESTLRLAAMQYKNNIVFECNFKVQPMIPSYPGQLNQVYMNIISNACHSIEEKYGVGSQAGKISISTEIQNVQVVIRISDNGGGMSEETRSRMFEPFYTTKAVGHGTGLGMSISFGIIAKHKGTIEAKSVLGEGTQVMINLPLKLDAE